MSSKAAKFNAEDRAFLLQLGEHLTTRHNALTRDEYGTPLIQGKRGHIYAWGDASSAAIVLHCGSARRWDAAKRALAFCQVTQNGGDEGVVRLYGWPTAEQAVVIRRLVGLPKRKELSPSHLAAFHAGATTTQFGGTLS